MPLLSRHCVIGSSSHFSNRRSYSGASQIGRIPTGLSSGFGQRNQQESVKPASIIPAKCLGDSRQDNKQTALCFPMSWNASLWDLTVSWNALHNSTCLPGGLSTSNDAVSLCCLCPLTESAGPNIFETGPSCFAHCVGKRGRALKLWRSSIYFRAFQTVSL